MESEKVKEIKKALEQNIKTGIGFLDEKEDKMFFVSIADILTLINELESENKALKKEIILLKQSPFETQYCSINRKGCLVNENGECNSIENCQYKISETEKKLKELE